LLAGTAFWIVRRTVGSADLVLDPRTGRNMAPPFPRWTVVLWLLLPAGILLFAYLSDAGR
jgi:hypothetical protein